MIEAKDVDPRKLEAVTLEGVEGQPIELQRPMWESLRAGETTVYADGDDPEWHFIVVGGEAVSHCHWTRLAWDHLLPGYPS